MPAQLKGMQRRVRRFEMLEARMMLAGDVIAYNDHVAGPATGQYVTSYATNGDNSGFLLDSQTGAPTSITLTTTSQGVSYETTTGVPAAGTDASNLFDGYVDFSSSFGSSLALSGNDWYRHNFSGLDPDADYDFAGTTIRGNTGYTNRWTLVTLVGAESFTPAHSTGLGVVTAGLPANQVAIWTGENHQSSQGFVAQWQSIDPGQDGEFEIVSEQYRGSTPGVGSGSALFGSKGYALTGVRLVEYASGLRVQATDPADGQLLTLLPTTYTVDFSEPVNPATIDASDLLVDGQPATAFELLDADTVRFTLPAIAGNGVHHVSLAEGAMRGSDSGEPLVAFSGSFALLVGEGVLINEIGYDVGDDSEPLEFVELYNAGSSAVDLSGWQLDSGVQFTLPHGTVLQSGEYLVIAQHVGQFTSQFGVPAVGPFDGRLSNEGEVLRLRDANGDLQDEVDYQLGYPWPTVGDVPGESIQLINPTLENDLGGSWRSAPVTPGASNAGFAINAPPQTRKVDHYPIQPQPSEDITVTVKATDPDGIGAVQLEYQLVNPGDYIAIDDPRYLTSWTTLAMVDDGTNGDVTAGDDIYTAILPGSLQTHRRLVRYRVTVEDTLGASVTVPYEDDSQPNFAYFVYGDTPDWTAAARPGVTPDITYSGDLLDSVATYHLITTRQAHEDSQHIPDSNTPAYGGSEYLWHGALVYDGIVYDHIRFRARGGVWRYSMGKNMWKFDFNRGHDFQARDDYGNTYKVPWSKLNLSAIVQQGDFWHRGEQGLFESVGYKLFNLAGVPASNTNYVSFRIIEDADENGSSQFGSDFQGLYLAIEQLNDNFLDDHDLGDGNLYKMENGTGVNGIGGELNNQGDYPQPNDSSDLIAFKTAYENSTQTAQWWDDNLDLEQYYSYRSIVDGIHHYDIGAGKNYFFYHNPDTDKWETVPWDLDLTWANNMYGDGNEPFRNRVLRIPEYNAEYRNRMREIRDLLFNADQVRLLVEETASFVYTAGQPSLVDADRAMWDYNPIMTSSYVNLNKANVGRYYAGGGGILSFGSYAGMMQLLVDYASTRGAWIDSNILTDDWLVPQTPTLTYSGDAGYPIGGLEFTTSPFFSTQAGFNAMEWRLAEVSNPDTPGFDPAEPWIYEIDSIWESEELTTFDDTLDLTVSGLEAGHTYRARVRMQDDQGRWSHWSDPVEFVTTPPIDVPTLAITELHYHPNNPGLVDESDQEFFEIYNTGTQTVNLAGIKLADFASNPYVFADGMSLAPGEYLVIARNTSVFESIYGTGINLAPIGYGDANLSNGGETLTLLAASGAEILSFTYGDSDPWPAAADGDGPSLEIIDPLGSPNDPTNWRASAVDGGSPGWSGESVVQLAGDYDDSGTVDQLDYQVWKDQFGQMPTSPGSGADGNGNGSVDLADYVVWRNNLGATRPVAALVYGDTELGRIALRLDEDITGETADSPMSQAALVDVALATWVSPATRTTLDYAAAVSADLTPSTTDQALLLLDESERPAKGSLTTEDWSPDDSDENRFDPDHEDEVATNLAFEFDILALKLA
ncbi:lamin tail domain-containing protein [Aeoliella sp. ICT_H6.2]|uniref:Lamin tail domain-containing protein n=1 Tax=Aeoliella straminimaris TaxID=2954799 RepID=A0A9X2JG53_9BACT|nr:lamin tail domain-containing protein [Aeoliella straminimaris]